MLPNIMIGTRLANRTKSETPVTQKTDTGATSDKGLLGKS